MDKTDKKLLEELQDGFPISRRPYLDLGGRIGIPENEAHRRVSVLREKGLIRRFRAIFDPEGLGYESTLVAMKAPRRSLDEIARNVGRFHEVTHNYLRDGGQFNLWFTIIAPSKKRINEIIARLKKESGVDMICQFPKAKLFKIKAKFEL